MKLAYFSGCKIPFYQKDYDLSFRAVMAALDVELVELPFNCCGNPARDENFEVSMFSAIKNLALAQKHGLDIITPCKCCFGQFKHSIYWYDNAPELKDKIDYLLSQEDLTWDKKINVSHFLSFLTEDFGLDALAQKIQNPLKGKRVVVQYGCHALRPFSITGFDHPFEPQIFEKVLELTGIDVQDWSKRTECCGHPILEMQPELSKKIVRSKYEAARAAGADFICTACTHCQMQYDTATFNSEGNDQHLQAVLLTHVIGAAMGLDMQLSFNLRQLMNN